MGAGNDHGQVADIDIFDLTVVESAGRALVVGDGSLAPPPYQISVIGGALGPGNKSAIFIPAGREIEVELGRIDGHIALDSRATENVSFCGNGSEKAWIIEPIKSH